MKYSILTFCFGNYESIKEPLEIDENAEYVLITDRLNISSKIWKIKHLDSHFNNSSGFTKSFYVRYHPFEFVNNDICVIIDGSILIKKSLSPIIEKFIQSNCDICLSVHTILQNPLYREYEYFVKERNYDKFQSQKNCSFIKSCGYTENYKGYFEANFKIVKNDNINNMINYFSWESLLKISPNFDNIDRLDQTIYSAIINFLFPEIKIYPVCRQIIMSSYMSWMCHGTNRPKAKNQKINYDNLWMKNKKIKVNTF